MSTESLKELILVKFAHIKDLSKGMVLYGEIYLKHKFNSIEEYDQLMESKDWDNVRKYGNSFEVSDGLFVKVIME